VKIRVYYEDTDAGGIVYHTNYIKYCERARSEYFFQNGLKPFEDESSGFVVRRIECDFIGRARLGDMLEVRTYKKALKRASLSLVQEIYLGNERIFCAHISLAYVSGRKPAKIPQDFATLFDSLPGYAG